MKVNRYDAHHTVPKNWGMEVWIVNNDRYCGKLLHFYPRSFSSVHRHTVKSETMFVESGVLVYREFEYCTEYLWKYNETVLRQGDSVDIPAGTYHQILNTGPKPGTIVEFSTFHDDDDVERLAQSGRIQRVSFTEDDKG